MKSVIQFVVTISLSVCSTALIAQQGTVPTGGDGTSAAGSIAFSIGQILYTPISGEAGHLNPGLQQPNISVIIAVDEPHALQGVRVYPNPAHDVLLVDIDQADNTIDFNQLSIQLYDMSGKLITEQKIQQAQTLMPVNEFTDGTYMLRFLHKGEYRQTFKIIKTH